jgi:hypothetical protein
MPFIHQRVDIGYADLPCETGEKGRNYVTPQGKKYPSITTVLSILSRQKILEWRKRVGEEEANAISRAAAGRGTSVHTLVEKYLNNEPMDESAMPNAKAAFRSLQPILDAHVGKIFIQEAPLYSDHLQVAGRCDLVAEFDGKISIVDIKTSKRAKDASEISSYFMQEAAYAIMFEERTGIPVTNLVTVMSVDFADPIIFREKRDNWTKSLRETIARYQSEQIHT